MNILIATIIFVLSISTSGFTQEVREVDGKYIETKVVENDYGTKEDIQAAIDERRKIRNTHGSEFQTYKNIYDALIAEDDKYINAMEAIIAVKDSNLDALAAADKGINWTDESNIKP